MIQTASVTGFLRSLLIILAIYYALKIITRLAAPYLMRYFSNKMQDKFGGHTYQSRQTQTPRSKEGETVIDKMPKKQQSSNSKVGEYIDFEEIE
ncbi:DUF4834 family protein [Aegicerativicinus sediminis]